MYIVPNLLAVHTKVKATFSDGTGTMASYQTICATLDRAVSIGIAPGMAVAFGRSDQSLLHYSAGAAMLQPQQIPLQNGAYFDLASLTKVLATTLIIMRFYERGILDIDAPLAQLHPGYADTPCAALSPRQLLAHCAGLPATERLYLDQAPHGPDLEVRRRETLSPDRHIPLADPPNSETRYSDLGPIVLGDLLEHLSQQRLDHLFANEVCSPLHIDDAFFVHLQTPLPRAQHPRETFVATEDCSWRQQVLCGQVHDENAYLLGGVAGHAGLFASLQAVEKLAQMLLLAAAGQSNYLSAKTLQHFTQRQHLVPDSSRALGWDTPSENSSSGQYFSANSFGHTGFTGTSLWIDREQNRYIALLANRVHPSRSNSAFLRFRPELHDQIINSMQLSAKT